MATGTSGIELYATNGTPAGTGIVRDINPGPADGVGEVSYLYTWGDKVWFAGNTATAGWELWRSDGTENGTVLVHDILPGNGSSRPDMFTPMGSHLYFQASQYFQAQQLLRVSDTPTAVHQQIDWAAELRLFPNPSTGTITVSGLPNASHRGTRIELLDATGRVIPLKKQDTIQGDAITLLTDALPGQYSLRIVAHDGSVHVRPMILQ